MWFLDGCSAHWESEQLQAYIDLGRPDRGLVEVSFRGQPLAGASLMQMHLQATALGSTLELHNVYTRGPDLVATYADTRKQLVCPEFLWRIGDEVPSSTAVIFETLVSTQTPLLDSSSEVTVQCVMRSDACHALCEPGDSNEARGELLTSRPAMIEISASGCALVFQLVAQPFVFGQIVDPGDASHAEVFCNAEGHLANSRVSYFRGRMEKGVIRRARLRGFLAGRDDSSQVLRDQWNNLLHAPPPLTT